ncbi:hypothetical protein [Sulfurivirga sp.]|uniref:hypothetical protein n=1 Tax=Sulfurivirga sp. TaxID=2614236 RepID=UPI0025F1FB33|nr:hypothetical protein [Sulfurivirga sp.]
MEFIAILFAIAFYFLFLSAMLKLAVRLVLRCDQPWGNAFKVTLIDFLVVMAVQVGLAIVMALFLGVGSLEPEAVRQGGAAFAMQLVMVLANIGVSAYVYSRWISCPGTDYEEGTGFWQGLGIYLVQMLVTVLIALIFGAGIGFIAAMLDK